MWLATICCVTRTCVVPLLCDSCSCGGSDPVQFLPDCGSGANPCQEGHHVCYFWSRQITISNSECSCTLHQNVRCSSESSSVSSLPLSLPLSLSHIRLWLHHRLYVPARQCLVPMTRHIALGSAISSGGSTPCSLCL